MSTVTYSVKETAAAVRKALAATFPGVKFSVRMDRGTAYGWLSVSWSDGPTEDAVRSVTDRFRDEKFDGMTDAYVPIAPSTDDQGVTHAYNCSGVTHSRSYTAAARERAEALIRADFPDVDDHCTSWSYPPRPINGLSIGEFYDLPQLVRIVLFRTDLTPTPA